MTDRRGMDKRMTRQACRALLAWALVATGAAGTAGTAEAPADLLAQLTRAAAMHDFRVENGDQLSGPPVQQVGGSVHRQVQAMLRDFNYIADFDATGRLTKVRIVGRKRPAPPEPARHVVTTRRYGSHHLVQATLIGAIGATIPVPLLVDTGATTVVLPASTMRTLGLTADKLQDGWSQTANGRVPVKRATLDGIQIGSAMVRQVPVTFIADDRLGNHGLLGMSFLAHFQVTLDDANSQMILTPK